jgi:hypothetical protein
MSYYSLGSQPNHMNGIFSPQLHQGNPYGVGSYGGRPGIGQAQVPSVGGFFPNKNGLGGLSGQYYSIGAVKDIDKNTVAQADNILKNMGKLSNAQKNKAFANADSMLDAAYKSAFPPLENHYDGGAQPLPIVVAQNYNDLNLRQKASLANTISQQIDFEAVDDEKKDYESTPKSIAAAQKELKDSIADAKAECKNDWKIDPSVVQSVIDGTVSGSNAVYYFVGGAALLGAIGFAYMRRR